MKQLLNGEHRRNGNAIALSSIVFAVSVILSCLVFSGCQKEATNNGADQAQPTAMPKSSEANTLNYYSGLGGLTMWQLQQARAASAKYRNIDNAIKAGYVDIAVDVQHMG